MEDFAHILVGRAALALGGDDSNSGSAGCYRFLVHHPFNGGEQCVLLLQRLAQPAGVDASTLALTRSRSGNAPGDILSVL